MGSGSDNRLSRLLSMRRGDGVVHMGELVVSWSWHTWGWGWCGSDVECGLLCAWCCGVCVEWSL